MLEFSNTTPANGKIKGETYAKEQGVQAPPEHTHKIKSSKTKINKYSVQYTTLWLWKPEFDSRIGHHVKKGKRGACRHKATTVLSDHTAAT